MRRAAGSIAVLLVIGLAGLMLVPALLGYRRYVVTGGSMGSALSRGSIAYERPVPVGDIRRGDVITYAPPGSHELVTHRVDWVGRGGAVRTKGDANQAVDPWHARLRGPEQAVVRFHVPLAGYAFAALAMRPVRIVVIGIPALLAALAALAGRRPRMAGEAA